MSVRARIVRLGGGVLDVVRAVVDLWLVYVSTIAGIVRSFTRRRGGRGRREGELVRQLYYIGTEYAGQAVVVTLRPHLQIFDVILGQTVIKSLSLKGLHHHLLPLDDYLHLICQEAESEYRQYLASQIRHLQADTM